MKQYTKIGFLVLLMICVVTVTFAQTNTARLQGTITDASGAAVQGASITVTGLGTGRIVDVKTNETGYYTVSALDPGKYKVEIKQTGFKNISQEITLQTQQVAALDFSLQPGASSETVEVTSDVPLVESASSNVSEVIVGRQITELPLNGRNFTQLATLAPGVTRGQPGNQQTGDGNQAETFRYNGNGGSALSVNGLRPQANNFLLDGVDNNENLVNTIIFFPPAEAIQEFRVDTSVAPAEFGRAGGGVVNTTYKSGTNSWHGSAFEFLRNDALDARAYNESKYDADEKEVQKREFKRNQFGAAVGGPIIKNKLFIFGDYQGFRQYLPFDPAFLTVPTAAMRTGDFSELLRVAADKRVQIHRVGGADFTGNIIPAGEIISVGQKYLQAFPTPNVDASNPRCSLATVTGTPVCVQGNFMALRTQIQHFNDFDIRGDWNISSKDTLFTRYSYANDYEVTSPSLVTLPSGYGSGKQFNYPQSVVVGQTHVFSDRLLNEFRFGWVHTKMGYEPPLGDQPISANLGIPNANTSDLLGGGALIGGNGNMLEYTGDYGSYIVPQDSFQYSDSVTWTKGRNNFKFGATIIRRHVDLFRPKSGKGFFNFGALTGYDAADAIAGFVNSYSVGPNLGMVQTRNWETGYYVQDDWRVTNRLTLNLGLRYDLYTWPSETENRLANFDLSTGKMIIPTEGSTINTDKNNFAPRVGFAYDINGNGKTVVRGGYGIFYFLDRGGIDNQLEQNAPFGGQSSLSYSQGYRFTLAGRAPDNSTNPLAASASAMPDKSQFINPDGTPFDPNNPRGVDIVAYRPDNVNSYVQQWNLQVQRELGSNTAFSIGYVGTKGTHLMNRYDYNRKQYVTGAQNFPNLGFVLVMDTNGNSIYHGLQTQLERRLAKGLQFTASYTWSHAIDDSQGSVDAYGQWSDPYDYRNPRANRANSALDTRHRFVFSALYELPFGRGREFGNNWNPIVNAVLGGWQISPIVTLQSGFPFDLIDGTYVGQQRVRPLLVGDPNQKNDIGAWFDTSAFAKVPVANGVFTQAGTAPRNMMVGPKTKLVDMSVSKTFSITEQIKTEFRGEFFNLFNTPQFGQPNGDITSGDFGKVTGTRFNSQRQVQLGLRLTF